MATTPSLAGSTSAVAYARLSDDREGSEAGVGAQLDIVRGYAEAQGLTLVAELYDNDISASRYSKKERPAYGQVLELLRSGQARHVVVRETSRLYRRPRDLEDLIDLCEHQGVSVHAPLGGRIDLSSGPGRYQARILAAGDAFESDRISDRVKYKHDSLAKAGKPSGGGRRPFGLRPVNPTGRLDQGYELVPGEVAILRDLARRVLSGESIWSLCDDLNARGITTTAGRTWQRGPLTRTLSSPHLVAMREHTTAAPGGKRKRVGLYPATWPELLSRDVWEALQMTLADRGATGRRAPRSRAYLLSGLVVCAQCSRPMFGHVRAGKRTYQCMHQPGSFPSCGRTITAASLEDYVSGYVFDQVDQAERRRTRKSRQPGADGGALDVAALDDRRVLLEAKRRGLAKAYADDTLSLESFIEADQRIKLELEGLTTKLRNQDTGPPVVVSDLADLRYVWDRATFAQRRRLIDQSVSRVVVASAGVRGRASKPGDRVTVDLKFPIG